MSDNKLFLIRYDNGLEGKYWRTKVLGVFDTLEKAKNYLLARGFNENEDEYLFFPRYEDSAIIQPIILNKTIEELHF